MSLQEMQLKFQIMIAIGVLLVTFIAGGLSSFTIAYFDLGSETSLFFIVRTLLAIVFPPLFIPLLAYGEFIDKSWKGRKFKWRNVGVAIGITGSFFTLTLLLLTICDMLFSQLIFVWQLPLTALCGLTGLISFALTVKRYKKQLDF